MIYGPTLQALALSRQQKSEAVYEGVHWAEGDWERLHNPSNSKKASMYARCLVSALGAIRRRTRHMLSSSN